MVLTKELLLERVQQFKLQIEALKTDLARFEALESYTEEMLDYLEKKEAPVAEPESQV